MRLIVLTDRYQAARAGRSLPETVAAATAAGTPTILFREKDLVATERRRLGEAVREQCGDAGLLVASDPDLAEALDAEGVHLAAVDPWPSPRELVVGRSCHSAEELADAAAHDADYATLSPVYETASKPGYGPPLGLDTFADLVATSALPVVALGGIDAGNAGPCLAAGADGVAVMGAVMGATDPGSVVARLLALEGPA